MNWRYEHTALTLVAAVNFCQLGARLIISPMIPSIIDTFDVSKTVIGLVLTGMWMAYALGQFPSGVLSDRFGERPLILVALGFALLASLLLALSPSFLFFGMFVILLGAGTGLFFAVASSLVTKLFDNTGQSLGILTASGAFAGLVFPILGAYVALWYGWRVSFAVVAAVSFAVLCVSIVWIRPMESLRPNTRLRDALEGGVVTEILSRPSIVYSLVLASILGFVWQSFTSFFPTFLVEYHDFTVGYAGIAFGVVFLLSTLSQPVVGRASDVFSRDGALGGCALITALGFCLLLFETSYPVVLVGICLLGVGISWGGVVQARLMDQFSDTERGTGFGLSRTIYMMLSALGSIVVGTLADSASWQVAYGLLVVLLLGAVGVLMVNRTFDVGL